MKICFAENDFKLTSKYIFQENNLAHFEFKLYDDGKLIFDGEDFEVPSKFLKEVWNDSIPEEGITALLMFLSVQKNTLPEEYFSDYTEHQIAWRDSNRSKELRALADARDNNPNFKLKVN